MKPPPKNIVASIQARLLQHSQALGVDHQLTVFRFAGERLLYRLSSSEYSDKFILKGAALMLVWRLSAATGSPTLLRASITSSRNWLNSLGQ